jgi:D-amino peptidase
MEAILKVLVFSDMEGASGIHTYRQVIKEFGESFEQGRKLLTDDVNAAIKGFREAGVGEFVVADSHRRGSPPNVIDELLPEGTTVIRGDEISRYDYSSLTAQVLVGFHSMAGTEGGFLSHTMSSLLGFAVNVNGKWVGEGELEVWKGGMFGLPTVMAAGDSAFASEIASFFPDIPTVAVKVSSGRTDVECLEPERTSEEIRRTAALAFKSLSSFKIHDVTGPVELAIAFRSAELADWAARMPETKRIHERAISYSARNWEQARAAYHTAYYLAQIGHTARDRATTELEKIPEVKRLRGELIRRSIQERWAQPFEPLPDLK